MNITRFGDGLTDDQLRQIAASRNAGISASVKANEAAGRAAAANQAAIEAASSARATAYNDGVIAAGGFRPAGSIPWIPIGAAIAAYFALKGH